MADQPARLEAATVKAEIGSGILYQFSNDAVGAPAIPTLSGDIPNLKQVILQIQNEGADKISFATKIFATTAAGIAATVDQEIFLVQSSDVDEIYAVWQNVGGTAVDTGKRSLSATAVIEATEAATAAAAQAQASADEATIRVARFLEPSATNPTVRDDGQPLQLGDRYLNTSDLIEYIYKNTGWVANNLDAQTLAMPSGASRIGAVVPDASTWFLPPVATETSQNYLDALKAQDDARFLDLFSQDLSKGVSRVGGAIRVVNTIADVRLTPKASNKFVFAKSYETGKRGGGGNYQLLEGDTTSVDNGGTILVNPVDGGRWGLIWNKTFDIRNFGIDNTGATDVSARMNVMITAAYNAGGARITGEGVLLINSTVLVYPDVQLEFKRRDSMRVISTVNNVTVFRTARPAGYTPPLAINCGVSGITFSLSGKYGGSTCIDISDAKDGKYDDLLFANCSHGLWFNKYAAANGSQFFGQAYYNTFSRISFQVCATGMDFQGASNENNFYGVIFGDCDDCFNTSRGDTNYSETNNFYGVRIEGCKNVVEPAVNRSQNYGWNFYGLVIENPTSNPFNCTFKDPSTWNVYGLTIIPADATKVILYEYFPGFYSNIVGSKGSSDRRSVGIRLAEEIWAIRGIRYVGDNVGSAVYSGSLGVGQSVTVAINVAAARIGDAISVFEDKDLLGVSISGKYVSASGVVTARLTNGSGGGVTLSAVTLTAVCSKIGAVGPVI